MSKKPKFKGKSLFAANLEYNNTNQHFKPLLCLIPENGLYIVTLWFSRIYCESKGLKVIK